MAYIVNPWQVSGNVDYDKVVKEFGVSRIDETLLKRIEAIAKKKKMKLHPWLERKIFFAHRDLNLVLDEYDKGKDFFLYTGRGPSAKMHIGHLVPFLFTKYLQDLFDVELYVQFTDDEKFLFKDSLDLETVSKHCYENMLDVIAVGFNPKKTHFIIDTKHANLLYPEAIKVAKRITFSTVKSVFGFSNENNIGEIFFTSVQAVPAFLPSVLKKKKMYCLIPHAIDQDPHFRISRDIIPKLGFPKPASIQCRFFPGLQGMEAEGKMSASEEKTSVFLSDSEEEVERKINSFAFSGGRETIEAHKKFGGNPEVDVAFQWLTFFEDDSKKLEKYHNDYKSGKMLSREMKAKASEKISSFLKQHQKNRKNAAKQLDKFVLKN